MQQFKRFSGIELKSDGPAGSFRATFATLAPAVDLDGDVTEAGAFKQGQAVVLSAYGHASWEGALPVGTGVIGANSSKAYVDGVFFLDTIAGRETYATVKALGPLVEFSYGYDVLEASFDRSELAAYPGATRILKSLDVFEVSPVLKGAGIATGLQSIKSAAVAQRVSDEGLKAIRDRLELQKIWAEVSARQTKAIDDDANAVEYIEVEPSAVEPTKHRVANLVVGQACADLGIKGQVDLRWFRPETLAESVARKAYFLEFGAWPSEEDEGGPENFRHTPIYGLTVKAVKQIWIRADLELFKTVETSLHECFHAARPDADHADAYEYASQGKAWAKSQVNMLDSEATQARTLAKTLQEFVGDALERQFGRPVPRPNVGSVIDSMLRRDINAPIDNGPWRGGRYRG